MFSSDSVRGQDLYRHAPSSNQRHYGHWLNGSLGDRQGDEDRTRQEVRSESFGNFLANGRQLDDAVWKWCQWRLHWTRHRLHRTHRLLFPDTDLRRCHSDYRAGNSSLMCSIIEANPNLPQFEDPVNGICGLAYPRLSSMKNGSLWWNIIHGANPPPYPFFTVWLDE